MALTREHGIILGVVVLGGLSFLVYKQSQKDEQLGTVSKAELPEVKGTDDLDKIELTNGDKGTVTLANEGGKWMVTAPVHAPASANNVKMMLENIKELKATERVASAPDDATKASYNLDPAHAVHFVGYKGADKKVDSLFGKSGGRGEMMMVSGKPDIVAASGFSSFLYTREAKDWREHDLVKYTATDAILVDIENKNGHFVCNKADDKWTCTADGKAIANFDDSKPLAAAQVMQYLVAEDFPPPEKTVAEAGLDKPEGIFTVGVKDNGAKYTMKLGAIANGSSRYAMRDGDPQIYIVNPNISDWATCKVDKLQKPVDAGAPPAAAKTASKK
jgi:hypothetical protein